MSTPEQPEEKPSIIIDDDYKAKVAAEKEVLRKQEEAEAWAANTAAATEPTAAETTASETTASETTAAEPPSQPAFELPPASFPVLVMMLSSQALAALGMAPGPEGKTMKPELGMAKHFIDTLGVIEEKTKGNLDEQEQHLLNESLTELRLAYVAAKKKA